MDQIHTHYDNLKVARNAPPEVIRAAYKTLSQKYHPDRNPGNAEAARIMAIINASYGALSDTGKRQEHDQWIKQQEIKSAQAKKPTRQPHRMSEAATQSASPKAKGGGVVAHFLRNWFMYCIAGFFIWFLAVDEPRTPPTGPKPYQAYPEPVHSKYTRPKAAPNGKPWPVSAAYIKGYKFLHADGLSSVTVDNSQNNSDVFVKLVSLDSEKAYPVRQFYIPAFGRFTLSKVTAGRYDIRYRDLGNGGLSRSEAFDLMEIRSYDGVQYSNTTMTLYKVQSGNMQTYGLSEVEF
jgi:curved DNA-binding protein CbpA